MAFQILVGGSTVWFDGALFGGSANAKMMWKYHRWIRDMTYQILSYWCGLLQSVGLCALWLVSFCSISWGRVVELVGQGYFVHSAIPRIYRVSSCIVRRSLRSSQVCLTQFTCSRPLKLMHFPVGCQRWTLHRDLCRYWNAASRSIARLNYLCTNFGTSEIYAIRCANASCYIVLVCFLQYLNVLYLHC